MERNPFWQLVNTVSKDLAKESDNYFEIIQGQLIHVDKICCQLQKQLGSAQLVQAVANFLGISSCHVTTNHVRQTVELIIEKSISFPCYPRKRILYRTLLPTDRWLIDSNRPKLSLTSRQLLDEGLISPFNFEQYFCSEIVPFTVTFIPIIYSLRSSQKPQIGIHEYLSGEGNPDNQISEWIEYRNTAHYFDIQSNEFIDMTKVALVIKPTVEEISNSGFIHQVIEVADFPEKQNLALAGSSLTISDNIIAIPQTIKEFFLPISSKVCWIGDFNLEGYLVEIQSDKSCEENSSEENSSEEDSSKAIINSKFFSCLLEIFSKIPLVNTI